MSKSIPFDTLAHAKKLKQAGFTEQQAEVQAEALAEIVNERVATKQDLKNLEYRLRHDIVLRIGGMIVAATAFLAAIKYFG